MWRPFLQTEREHPMSRNRDQRQFNPAVDRLDTKVLPSDFGTVGLAPTAPNAATAAVAGVNDDPAESRPYLSTFTEVGDLAGPTRPFVPRPTITPSYVGVPSMYANTPDLYDHAGNVLVPSYGKTVWYPNLTLAP